MKKILLLFAGVAAFGGCKDLETTDYGGYGFYVWENRSEHTVKISIPEDWFVDYKVEPPHGEIGLKFELAPGERFEAAKDSGYGSPYGPDYFQKISVLFDDEYGVEFRWKTRDEIDAEYDFPYFPERYDSRYDLFGRGAYHEERVENPNGCKQCVGIRWTYTFTNGDYYAAVDYNGE